MVDFIEASLLRYALTVKPTVYVFHIRQFWSTARIETIDEGTQILATVDSIHRTVTESYLRRNLKLQDEEGISSLPDTELFENLTLMGYNISPNQKFTSQKGLVKNVNYKISKFLMYPRIVPLFDTMLVQQGEGSGTPTKPHYTSSPEAQSPSHTTHTSPSLPPVTTTFILIVTPTETTPIKQYTRRARIAQSSALLTQDITTIDKSSTLPHNSAPRVTSPIADEGSMQQTILELTALCTSLQRQLSELTAKFQAQEVEVNKLKERVKMLEDRKGVAATRSRDDAPIKERSMDEGEATTERISDDSEEMATVLTSMDAATVLASGAVDVLTGSGSIPIASTPAEEQVPTGSDVVPTASLVFATTIVVTPYRKRKGKEVVSQQRKPWTKKQKRDYYMAVIRSNLGWKVKDFRGMTFEEVKEKFNSVWKQMEDFIPIGSKEEAERIKKKGLNLEQESAKKQKTSEEVPGEAMSPKVVSKEKVKEMMQLVPIEEVYVEALQVKHPIID
nr:hypothetical protein [Tanacetum cinerariifolium]